jgi:hypothetical protein
MSKLCVVVLGIHRCGSSAVAGVVHHLGTNMGGPGFADVSNPKGHYEDEEFVELHMRIFGEVVPDGCGGTMVNPARWRDPAPMFEPWRDSYARLIRHREENEACWGVKDPRLCYLLPWFLDLVRDPVYLINVTRPIDESAQSLLRRDASRSMPHQITIEEMREVCDRYLVRKREILDQFSGPILDVVYDFLVREPAKAVEMIAHFLRTPVTQEALEVVDPALRHFSS